MAYTGTAGGLRRLMGMLPLHGRSTANLEEQESEGESASTSLDAPLMCAVNAAANSAGFQDSDSNKENTMPITDNDGALCDDVSVAHDAELNNEGGDDDTDDVSVAHDAELNNEGGDDDTDDGHDGLIDAPNKHVPMSEDDLAAMKIADIKLELSIRDVAFGSSWNKTRLLEHLKEALQLQQPVVHGRKGATAKPTCAEKDKDNLVGFAPGAYWKPLTPMATVVEEPTTTIKIKTKTVDEDVPVLPKHNFKETFDRPPFVGTVKRPVIGANGAQQLDGNGEPVFHEELRPKGCANPQMIKKYGLNKHSIPTEFVEPFFPFHEHRIGNKKGFSVALLCEWTNIKAVKLSNGGEHYKNYNHNRDYFVPKDVRQMLGLYVLNGISHSPSIECKFYTNDQANGNPFVQQNITLTRFKHFKAFFACQDPTLAIPPKKEHGNWFVKPFVDWINYIGPLAWLFGANGSVDKQTIAFKGRSGMKQRIKFKRASDGFMCDALCESGFTYQVYFQNEPSPRKCKRMGLSDLHARVMALFDSLDDCYTRIWMDNLYVSAKFCRSSYNHDKKLLVAGVARLGSKGVPRHIIQREPKEPKRD